MLNLVHSIDAWQYLQCIIHYSSNSSVVDGLRIHRYMYWQVLLIHRQQTLPNLPNATCCKATVTLVIRPLWAAGVACSSPTSLHMQPKNMFQAINICTAKQYHNWYLQYTSTSTTRITGTGICRSQYVTSTIQYRQTKLWPPCTV